MNVYDFDETIYDGDSTRDFFVFCLFKHKKIFFLLPYIIYNFILYFFKIQNKTNTKEKFYKFLLFCDIDNDLEEFWIKNSFKIKKFYYEKQKEDDVIISASPEFLLEPIINKLKIKYLYASRVDKFTGKYFGNNCHGQEKVNRFYENFPSGVIDEFYSDSYSDLPLAKISKKSFLVKGNKISKWL